MATQPSGRHTERTLQVSVVGVAPGPVCRRLRWACPKSTVYTPVNGPVLGAALGALGAALPPCGVATAVGLGMLGELDARDDPTGDKQRRRPARAPASTPRRRRFGPARRHRGRRPPRAERRLGRLGCPGGPGSRRRRRSLGSVVGPGAPRTACSCRTSVTALWPSRWQTPHPAPPSGRRAPIEGGGASTWRLITTAGLESSNGATPANK